MRATCAAPTLRLSAQSASSAAAALAALAASFIAAFFSLAATALVFCIFFGMAGGKI